MNDQDVRDMLAERARAIRPSTDGLAKIEARLADTPVAARRRLPSPMLAAAAVTVLALVGAAVFVQRDDDTVVDTDGPVATAPASDVPDGVWPWPGDDVDPVMLTEAEDTARVYVESRVGAPVENGFVFPTDDGATVTFTTGVSTVVTLREEDGSWYVVGAASELVTLHDAGDGTTTARIETDGELEQQTNASYVGPGVGPIDERTPVSAGVELTGLAYDYDEPGVARRRFVLYADDGTIGLTEVLFRSTEIEAITSTTLPATALPPGVWPFPQDDVDDAVLGDPIETARAYVDARVGLSDRTTVSEYQAGDSNSGEVVFGGDIQTTVFVRRLDGVWHVEGAASDLVTLHDADGDGLLTAVVEAKGWLQSFSVLSTGSSAPLVEAREYDAGEEITEGLAFDLNTDQVVKAVRFLLTSGPEGTKGLTEVAFRPPFVVTSTVPDDAVWFEGGLDAREVAVAYLADRLPGRTVRVDEPASIDKGRLAEVTWEAGVIRLRQLDGYWYVVEAIGDSIQLRSSSVDVGYVSGTLALAQTGTVHLTVGGVTWDVRNDIDAEGTDVRFDHEVPTDSPVILRAVFETDTGFASVAERVIG